MNAGVSCCRLTTMREGNVFSCVSLFTVVGHRHGPLGNGTSLFNIKDSLWPRPPPPSSGTRHFTIHGPRPLPRTSSNLFCDAHKDGKRVVRILLEWILVCLSFHHGWNKASLSSPRSSSLWRMSSEISMWCWYRCSLCNKQTLFALLKFLTF